MPVVITREAAIAAVEAEIARLESEPCAFDELHIVCAIEAIRRGDHEGAINHVWSMRCGPTLEEGKPKESDRPLRCRNELRALLRGLVGSESGTVEARLQWRLAPAAPQPPPPAPPSTHLASRR